MKVSGLEASSSGNNANMKFTNSNQSQYSNSEYEKVLEKNRALMEENVKLKDLLKRNEALIETRLAESKLE